MYAISSTLLVRFVMLDLARVRQLMVVINSSLE